MPEGCNYFGFAILEQINQWSFCAVILRWGSALAFCASMELTVYVYDVCKMALPYPPPSRLPKMDSG